MTRKSHASQPEPSPAASPATKTPAPSQPIAGLIPLQQKDIVLLLEAGYLYMEMNKAREAEEIFSGVAALIPHSEVPHMALGNLFFSLGRFAPALKAHQKAMELNPNSAAAHAGAAESLFFLHRAQEALSCLARATVLDPQGAAGEFAKALKEAHQMGIFG